MALLGKSLLALLAVFLLCFAPPALALPPQRLVLEPPKAGIRGGTLTLTLSLTVDNEDGLRDLLKDGAVLDLLISVIVERERSWWSNAEVVNRDFSSIMRHDPLSREFIVSFPAAGETEELRDRNLTRLIHNSWRKLVLPVASLELLKSEHVEAEALLHLSISLQHTEVPPWLEKSLIFWSSEVVPKEQRTLKVTLPAKP